MNNNDVKIGQRVRYRDVEWIVLDRHPDQSSWWLQDATTGAVGESARADFFDLVSDEYRDTPTISDIHGNTVIVKHRVGEWAVASAASSRLGWSLYHVPSGRHVQHYDKWTLTRAKAVASKLADVTIGDGAKLTDDERARLLEAVA